MTLSRYGITGGYHTNMERAWSAKACMFYNKLFLQYFYIFLWRFKSSSRHHISEPYQTTKDNASNCSKSVFFQPNKFIYRIFSHCRKYSVIWNATGVWVERRLKSHTAWSVLVVALYPPFSLDYYRHAGLVVTGRVPAVWRKHTMTTRQLDA
jgi:hypothetical protein